VVEDEQSNQRQVRLLLEQEGHVTEGASTGPEALERLSENTFNMVVLDLMLGPFSGWQVLREMERLSLRRGTRVLVLTARNSERDILHGWRMGADDYVELLSPGFWGIRSLASPRPPRPPGPPSTAGRRLNRYRSTAGPR